MGTAAVGLVSGRNGDHTEDHLLEKPPTRSRDRRLLAVGLGRTISCILLWRRYGFSFVKPLLWGGVAYTLGVVVLGLKWPTLIPGVVSDATELWHVAVLLGLGLHWKFIFNFASGPPSTRPNEGALNRESRPEPSSIVEQD